MMIKELTKPEYIQIRNAAQASFGGSQMWFSSAEHLRGDIIRNYGCGVIAAGDLLLYLAKTDAKALTNLTEPLAGCDIADRALYMEYIKQIERKYGKVLNHFGKTGFGVSGALNHYFRENNLCYKAAWNQLCLTKNFETTVCAMLENDLPVILSIPGVFFKQNGLNMFGSAIPKTEESSQKAAKFQSKTGHFVTATALITMDNKKRFLKITSWGKRYYLDTHELKQHLFSLHGVMSCGFVQIAKLQNPQRTPTVRIQL